MTHLFSRRILTLHKPAKPAALLLAALFSTALMSTSPAVAQTDVGNKQKLEGAWRVEWLGDPGSLSGKTSGFFNRDGTLFIQNQVPDGRGIHGLHGTGEWVRSGNRQFDLTWIYPIVSSVDGSYIGEFKDLARIHYNADGTLEGISTFKFTLADGTVTFTGSGRLKMVRVQIEHMP